MQSNKRLIDEIVFNLKEKGLISKEEKVKNLLEDLFSDRILIQWWTDDVQTQFDNYGESRISSEDARKVLDYIVQKHDPEVGINWQVIQVCAEELADRGEVKIDGYEPQDDEY